MDDAAFDAWAAARRLPPGLTRGRPRFWLAGLRRRWWRPLRNVLFETGLWLIGQHAAGRIQALDVRVAPLDLPVPGLDPRLDGLSILHLSDLHLGYLPGGVAAIAAAVAGLRVDLCVLTGDYAPRYTAPAAAVVAALVPILDGVDSRHGVFLTLGNYDSARLARALRDEPSWRLLVNEQAVVAHGGATVRLTGLDDPYEQAHGPLRDALATGGEGFRIVLAHAPELAAAAAAGGADLYLCGHTHGGQICLPRGRPIFRNTRRPDLACGLWREGAMWGYTTRGAGVSGMPRRHNCPPEVALIRLRAVLPPDRQ
ncbi:MAG: metallophosphoesterase [Alphaproteobacteria bacterium]|nr:metallophosphoesterase [Alphaproteobacteria bacterium]